MNKKLLALAIVPAVLASMSSQAAFVDASGGFDGELEFNGTITNNNPIWMVQIDESADAMAKDWNTSVLNGINQSDGSIMYDFSSKPTIPFVQGYMNSAATTGGPGISPTVTISTATGDVIVVGPTMANKTTGINPVTLDVSTEKDGEVLENAKLKMNVSGVTAGAIFWNNKYWWNNSVSGFGAAQAAGEKAVELLKASPDFLAIYASKGNSAGETKDNRPNEGGADIIFQTDTDKGYGLTQKAYKNVIGAFATTVSQVQLVVNEVPDTWYAKLPVTVTIN